MAALLPSKHHKSCMDSLSRIGNAKRAYSVALDVTDLPVSAVRRDQMVTLIGEGLSLDEVAAQAGTISYEVLTGLGHRFHRVWKS